MAIRILTLLTTLLTLITYASAASLLIKIPGSTILPNPNTLSSSTHATLLSTSGHPLTALLRKDNTLIFPSIPTTGTHLLKIYNKDYTFASYRIDLVSSPTSPSSSPLISAAYETYPGTQWTDHGLALHSPDSSPPTDTLTIYPKLTSRKSFYTDRAGFSPMSLLKNPMILMGGMALLLTFGLPKLMENMDPEMKAEYEEMQKSGPMAGISKAMSGQGPASSGASNFDLAGFLAGAQTQSAGASGSGKSSGSGREGAESMRERRK